MKRAAQDVRLGELSAPLIAEEKAGLPLANEILEHLRHHWVQIDFTLAAFGLQVIVNLTPPRLLTDLDCGERVADVGLDGAIRQFDATL